MLKVLLFSFKKSRILFKIGKEVSRRNFEKTDFLQKAIKERVVGKTLDKVELYTEELLALLAKDAHTVDLLTEYKRNFDDVRKIILKLKRLGAGQIIKGHYVAVSSIAFLSQLHFILQHWNGEDFAIDGLDTRNSNLKMADYLLKSFN